MQYYYGLKLCLPLTFEIVYKYSAQSNGNFANASTCFQLRIMSTTELRIKEIPKLYIDISSKNRSVADTVKVK